MSLNKTYNTIVGGVEYIDEGARILNCGGLRLGRAIGARGAL